MASYCHLQELRNGLRIKASRDIELWQRLLMAVLAGGMAAGITNNFFREWLAAVISAVPAGIAFLVFKKMRAELLATNVEFISTGDLGPRAAPRRVVYTADIRDLQFQEPRITRAGVYARTSGRDQCVLPFVEYLQAVEVIRAIESKFPGLAERWKGNRT